MKPFHRFGGAPYGSISAFYFTYFGILGVLIPYWNLYLEAVGFAALHIGLLTGATQVARVVSPYLAGWLVDHGGRTMVVIRVACGLAALAFAGLFLADSLWWIAVVTVSYNFFWSCCLSQFEANTLLHLQENTHLYSRLRLSGSVGFIVLVAGVGVVLEQDLALLLPILLGLMVTTFAISLWVPEAARPRSDQEDSRGLPVSSRGIGLFFLVCALMQASHGPYYTFFSIYLENEGYGRGLVGGLWALGVLSEVLVFLIMPALLARFGVRRLMLFSLAAAALRWMLIGALVQSLSVLLFVQLLHAATFALFHGCAMVMMNDMFPPRFRGRGLALYSSLGFGVGGAVGGLAAGMLWDMTGPVATFGFGSGLAGLALLLAARLPLLGLRAPEQQ